MDYQLHYGDCLEIMPTLEAGSVDAIICDLPYQKTACHWDKMIPLEPLWAEYKRLIKKNGAVVLFGSQPFTSMLVMSNLDWFKYEWIWEKTNAKGHLNSKIRPLMATEDVCIFADGNHTYNPQGLIEGIFNNSRPAKAKKVLGTVVYGGEREFGYSQYANYPRNLIKISNPNNGNIHPTQKPTALLEYLVRTYTNPGDVVLDNTFGSCTTGEACLRTGRRFIGIEKDADYFRIGQERLERVKAELSSMLPNFQMIGV